MELYSKKKYFFYEKNSLVFDIKEDCKSLVFSLQSLCFCKITTMFLQSNNIVIKKLQHSDLAVTT